MNWDQPFPCIVPGCERTNIRARGMCVSHYAAWWNAGKPNPEAFPKMRRAPVCDNSNLPNPWAAHAPSCPRGHGPDAVRLWHPEGELRWFCVSCGRRFDVAKEMAA